MRQCPAPEELKSLLSSESDTKLSSAIWSHVETCASCQQALETCAHQSEDDELAKLLDAQKSSAASPRLPDLFVDRLVRSLEYEQTMVVPDATQTVEAFSVRKAASNEHLTLDTVGDVEQYLGKQQRQRHEVSSLIARGGMGAVFDAQDKCIRRQVAMKIMRAKNASPAKVMRFVEEAQITGQLEHPSIIPVHELGVDETGQVFYTMKRIHGRTLKAILAAISRGDAALSQEYSLNRLLNVFTRVCDAMAFAHSKGVIHRDLKPENIMVGEFGEVLVMDWGLAKVLNDPRDENDLQEESHDFESPIESIRNNDSHLGHTIDGAIMGTPKFMAPEQAEGNTNAINRCSDIYALGAVLYNLLALQPAIQATNTAEVLHKVREGVFDPPTLGPEHRPRFVPHALAKVCLKAMSLEPADRYASVGELIAEVDAFQSGFATSAENAGFVRQVMLLTQRNKGIARAVAVAALLLVASSMFYVFHLNRERNRADENAANAVVSAEAARTAEAKAQREASKAKDAEVVAVTERDATAAALSIAQISLADAAFAAGDPQKARMHLAECPESHRDTNWRYLHRHTDEATIIGSGYKRSVVADPQTPGAFFVEYKGAVRHVDGRTGEVFAESKAALTGKFQGANDAHIVVSADGSKIALAGRFRQVIILDRKEFKEVARFEDERIKDSLGALFSHDAKSILIRIKRDTLTIDLESGKTAMHKEIAVLGVSPAGDEYYAIKAKRAVIVKASDYTVLSELSETGNPKVMAVSNDGSRLVIGDWESYVFVYDTSTRELLKRFYTHTLIAIAISDDNSTVLTHGYQASEHAIRLWSARPGMPPETIRTFVSRERYIPGVAWDSRSQIALVCSSQLRQFKTPPGDYQVVDPPGVQGRFVDESKIAIAAQGAAQVIDLETKKVTQSWPKYFQTIASRTKDTVLAVRLEGSPNNTISKLISLRKQDPDRSIQMPRQGMNSAAVSPGGRYAVAHWSYLTYVVERLETGEIKTIMKITREGSPKIPRILSGLDTRFMFPAGDRPLLLAAYLCNEDDSTFRQYELLDLKTGKQIRKLVDPIQAVVMLLDSSGKTMIYSGNDGVVRSRNAVTLQAGFAFRAHDHPVWAMAISPDGNTLVTGDIVGLIRFWNMKDGEPVEPLREVLTTHGEIRLLDFSPSGDRLLFSGHYVTGMIDVDNPSPETDTPPE